MFGVVLWSNSDNGTAVIWCEDQGDLAVLDCKNELQAGIGNVQPGDLLRFEIHQEDLTRRARKASLVACDHAPELASVLEGASKGGQKCDAPGQSRVIPFPARATASHRAPQRQGMSLQA